MNSELKQRIIGAVVVTALAAIFVPMLFDDPVDNSAQSVTELTIPPTPTIANEELGKKLPKSARHALKPIPGESEETNNLEEEPEVAVTSSETDTEIGDGIETEPGQTDGNLSKLTKSSKVAPEEMPLETMDRQPEDDAGSLDTGIIEEHNANKVTKNNSQKRAGELAFEEPDVASLKKPLDKEADTKLPKAVIKLPTTKPTTDIAVKTKPVASNSPTETSKQISTVRPIAEIAVKPKAVASKSLIKKPNTFTAKQESGVKPIEAESIAKPRLTTGITKKANSELVRWYVHVGSFSQKENVFALLDTLSKQNLPVTVETIKRADKSSWYHLKIGPELDKKRADAIKNMLDKQNIKTNVVAD